jgi:hypothetical protein
LLIAALTSGKADLIGFLDLAYPLRSQVVTFAVIGFHRDRGVWPTSDQELLEYATSSPANPELPTESVEGFAAEVQEDGTLVYPTLEDRQRGREFTVTTSYRVTFPMAKYPFATADSTEATASHKNTVSFNWGDAIANAILQLAMQRK